MKDEKEYRIRIQKEKETISDVEIFTSSQYVKMLRAIAREITDGTFENIEISQKPNATYMGWCDGNCIEINILNKVTQSFLTKRLKSESLVGVLGHECGHYNLTNFKMFEKYLNGFLDGIWYPSAPNAENEHELEKLEQIKECFEGKNRIALSIIKETAALIWNLLEDIYVENQMCRKYPGSICRGILQNRSRNGEWIPSLRKQLHMGYSKLSIITNLIVQYTLYGTINNWDGYVGKLSELLEEIKPIIEKAVKEPRESFRFIATNQIILKIWGILSEVIEEVEEGHEKETEGKKPQESTESSKTQEDSGNEELLQDTIERFLSQVPQFLQKTNQSGMEKNQENPSDEEWSGKWKEPGNVQQNPLENVKEEQTATSEGTAKKLEIDEKFSDLLLELAKLKVKKQVQKEIKQALQEELKETQFEAGHREVRKVLKRATIIEEKAKIDYQTYEIRVKKILQRMRATILPILRKKETRIERKLWLGKELDRRYIANPNGAIFQKRNQMNTEISAAVAVLIDISDSMQGLRVEYAKLAALCLYEFCRTAGIPITVYGHHTDGYVHKYLPNETVFLHSCAEFEPDSDDRYRILQLHPRGANRDGVALLYMEHKLLKRPEKHKILTIISDGFPNANFYNGEAAKKDLKQIRKRLMKEDITILAAAIGADKEAIKEIYQESYMDISELEKLPLVLSKKIMRFIRRY